MMNIYLHASTAIFLFLFVFWKPSSVANLLLKILMMVMGITGIILCLINHGYILKV